MRPLLPMVVFVSTALLAGCGGSAGGGDSAAVASYVAANPTPNSSTASNASAGNTPTCPTTTDVKNALGFDVRELTKGGMRRYGPMWTCGFAATDETALPGVTVQFTIEPGSEADGRFAEMRRNVTIARGQQAEPDPVALGDRGMAYRTSSRTMAAALAKGQLYSVDVRYGAVSKLGDKQPGIVTLLRQLMGA